MMGSSVMCLEELVQRPYYSYQQSVKFMSGVEKGYSTSKTGLEIVRFPL